MGVCLRPRGQPSFQEVFRQVFSTESERQRCGEHQSAPSDPESDDHDVLGDAELFEGHRHRQQLNAPSGSRSDPACRREAGIDGGDQDGLGNEIRREIADDSDHAGRDQARNVCQNE